MKRTLLFAFLFCFYGSLSFSQLQMGSTLVGSSAGDLFGWRVSLSADGQTLAVGASTHDNANGEVAGEVRVYSWDGQDWVQQGAALEGSEPFAYFGTAIALSADGQRLAVGAAGATNSSGESGAGKVIVYDWDGSEWVPLGGDIEGDGTDVFFGSSVALSASGEVLAVGVPFNNANFLAMSGSAFVYAWDGTSWQQTASFDGENAQDLFGAELSLSDDGHVLAVGAYLHNESVNSLGAVYVYAENGGNWALQGEPLYGDSLSYFGGSLALSGDGQTLVVGASSENEESGSTYVYAWDGMAWQQKGSSITGENGERMGKGVAINEDGSVFCTGAPFFHGYYGPNTGRAQVYAWDGSDWNQQGVDVEGMLSGNECGNAVAVSDDGSIVAVGAFHSDDGGFHSGNVRVFEICPPTTSELTITACQSYTVPSGDTAYTSSGVYTDEVLNAAACGDSVITIFLTILPIDASFTVSGTTLTANQSNGTYQWLDCENGIPITGATSQSFTPSQSGTYAVVVTANGCVDTSACEEVIITSVLPEAFEEDFSFYPNPVGDKLYVKLGTPYARVDVFVRDELGRLLAHEAYQQVEDFVLDMSGSKEGLYFIQVLADGRRSRVFKVRRGGL